MSVPVGGSEVIPVGALGIRFLVESADSAGSATVFEVDVPVGAHVPAPHSHDGFEETIYGLDGVTAWTVGGRSVEIGPRDAVCIQRGVIHGFVNDSDADAKFLAVATPGVFGPDFFREMGDVLAAAHGGPPDRERIGAVMRRHGLTPAPPG